MAESTQLRIIMTKEDLENEKGSISKGEAIRYNSPEPVALPKDTQLREARFVELVGVVALGTAATLASRLANNWIKGRENGTLLDLRKVPAEVSLVRNIPQGTLIIIDQDGKSQVHKADSTHDLTSFITGLLTKAKG